MHGTWTGVIARTVGGLILAAATVSALPPPVQRGEVSVELELVARGLVSPLEAVAAPGDTSRLYIVEQPGRVRVVENGLLQTTPFLDVSLRIKTGDEYGLLGFAFHPDYADSTRPGYGTVYTYTTEPVSGMPDFTVPMEGAFSHEGVLAEWKVSASGTIDPATRREVLRFSHPQQNHSGGTIAFRPSDGYLYMAIGDGGLGSFDQGPGHTPGIGNAQDTNNLLGDILRLDPLDPATTPGSADAVSGNGKYRIPADNPFVGQDGLDEIFAFGFRNPYRFSFDPATDRLIAGDVGQAKVEEVDLVVRGGNYGWVRKEGSYLFNRGTLSEDTNPDPALIDPVLEYGHGDGAAVIGGYIYRGSRIPALSRSLRFRRLPPLQPGHRPALLQ